MKWPNWRIDMVGIALLVALPTLVYCLGIAPGLAAEERGREMSDELSDRESKARTLQASLTPLDQSAAKLQEQIRTSAVTLDEPYTVNLKAEAVSELATRHGFQVDLVTPGELKRYGKFGVTPIQIAGNARYRNCGQLLQALRREMPEIVVTGMLLQKPMSDNGAVVNVRLDLACFTLPEDAQPEK